jgi:hypothetical protein
MDATTPFGKMDQEKIHFSNISPIMSCEQTVSQSSSGSHSPVSSPMKVPSEQELREMEDLVFSPRKDKEVASIEELEKAFEIEESEKIEEHRGLPSQEPQTYQENHRPEESTIRPTSRIPQRNNTTNMASVVNNSIISSQTQVNGSRPFEDSCSPNSSRSLI